MSTTPPDILGIVKALQERGGLKEFSPYCIGLVGKEEAEVLDCREGDEYALFHDRHRRVLCDWFGGKLHIDLLAQALLIAMRPLIAHEHLVRGECIPGCVECEALAEIRSLPLP